MYHPAAMNFLLSRHNEASSTSLQCAICKLQRWMSHHHSRHWSGREIASEHLHKRVAADQHSAYVIRALEEKCLTEIVKQTIASTIIQTRLQKLSHTYMYRSAAGAVRRLTSATQPRRTHAPHVSVTAAARHIAPTRASRHRHGIQSSKQANLLTVIITVHTALYSVLLRGLRAAVQRLNHGFGRATRQGGD